MQFIQVIDHICKTLETHRYKSNKTASFCYAAIAVSFLGNKNNRRYLSGDIKNELQKSIDTFQNEMLEIKNWIETGKSHFSSDELKKLEDEFNFIERDLGFMISTT